MAIFRVFIVSNFNYCPLVWHFCGKTNTSKIEKLQERALRFVFNDFTSSYDNTVVPALGDPRRERPPAVCGHFVNVPTHFKVKLPVISGHLPNADADSHLLVVSTCYNGQFKQMPRFGGHFNQKSLARIQTCDRQISQISVLSSGDYDNACIH